MKRPCAFFLFFSLFLVCFSSCVLAMGVMGLPRKEAAKRLKEGDSGFILEANIPAKFSSARSAAKELGRIHPSAPFYAGLLVKPVDSSRGKALFAAALESPSPHVRREAAAELVLPVLEDGKPEAAREILSLTAAGLQSKDGLLTLRAACLYRLGKFDEIEKLYPVREDPSSWDEAIFLLARLNREKGNEGFRRAFKTFLFSFPQEGGSPEQDSLVWAVEEFLRLAPEGFSPVETAALAGRAAANRSDFVRGIQHFRLVLEEEPEFFFQNAAFIADLGRCFQFNQAARDEGAALFAAWSLMFENSPERNALLRYRLLYFAGRIERQREEYGRSGEYFRQAMDRAPDPLQSDACLWYILMNALAEAPEAAADLVTSYMPRMNSPEYFSDILDKLSRYLVSEGRWETMQEVFSGLRAQGTNGAMIAQYAWILGRALEEGLLRPLPGDERDKDEAARGFFRIAFGEKKASLYYRVMSASKLETALILSPPAAPAGQHPGAGPEMEFLRGFFEFGASGFVYPYILKMEKDLAVEDLRTLAEALAASERRNEALNLISRYMAREDYEINSEDMVLYYPRHFNELIENGAGEAGLGVEILFGLVRTESYFMPDAVSRSGAVGLTQLMEPTALDMAGRMARRGGPDYRSAGGIDLKDPETNIRIGAYYLSYLTEQMGSPMMALLAYNGGMGRVRRWRAADRDKLPEDLFLETILFDETREYGRRVLAAAAVYGYLYYGMSMEEVVADVYR